MTEKPRVLLLQLTAASTFSFSNYVFSSMHIPFFLTSVYGAGKCVCHRACVSVRGSDVNPYLPLHFRHMVFLFFTKESATESGLACQQASGDSPFSAFYLATGSTMTDFIFKPEDLSLNPQYSCKKPESQEWLFMPVSPVLLGRSPKTGTGKSLGTAGYQPSSKDSEKPHPRE